MSHYHGPGVPRRYWLIETDPVTIVAEGIQFSNGTVSVCWPGNEPTIQDAASIEQILADWPGLEVHWLDRDKILDRCIA